jgi:hypothetical protein
MGKFISVAVGYHDVAVKRLLAVSAGDGDFLGEGASDGLLRVDEVTLMVAVSDVAGSMDTV